MKQELISVIIPVFNTPLELLKKCLNSLYAQTYSNIEIIIVDDGSDDKYKKAYRKDLIKKDYNIRIIDKQNTGVSDTRNVGIKEATGMYIMFLDSDDYIGKSYISEMHEALKNNGVNISISGATIVDETGKKINSQLCKLRYNTNLQIKDIIETMINYPYFTCVKMLIKKEIISDYFDSNIKYGEDLLFAFKLIKENDIVYLKNCDYYYVQNNNSATHNYSYESICKYLEDNLTVFDYIASNCENMKEIINIRLFTKFDIALDRYIKSYNCNFIAFKRIYKEYVEKYKCKKVNYKDIYYLNFFNKIKVIILHKKLIRLYFILSIIKKYIKKI